MYVNRLKLPAVIVFRLDHDHDDNPPPGTPSVEVQGASGHAFVIRLEARPRPRRPGLSTNSLARALPWGLPSKLKRKLITFHMAGCGTRAGWMPRRTRKALSCMLAP